MAVCDVISASDAILWQALGSYRPDGSKGIQALRDSLQALAPVGSEVDVDKAGNLWIDTRFQDSQGTMFCAHLDAVHPAKREGSIPLFFSAAGDIVHTGGEAVLGADDGAGVAILAAMLVGGIPGLYLFSQGEETGGRGMRYAVRELAYRVSSISRCIAFDRRGTSEICGAQGCGTLASVAFVEALSEALGLDHVWGRGSYTDNSEWQGAIPEIVNISVGYELNHSKLETLDWVYFQSLRLACLSLDWEALPTEGPAIDPVDVWGGYRSAAAKDYLSTSWGDDWAMGAGPDPVDDEWRDLCDSLGFDVQSYEAQLVLDSLSRVSRL